ncbi:G-protein coupled receptor 4-like [Labrus mixtus]|uniref:G-protein coupled receptor 4-like n=1 Tax=Labrus mixtus TaxID=508554 RepID=UPI0029C08223|nr:G-protein coupled receptor 4-like [Labrus mixtus]
MEYILVNNTAVEENLAITDYWFKRKDYFSIHVVTCIIISISLPLILMTICALYSLVRKDHVAPIYVINLLISDLIQLCCMIILETKQDVNVYKTAFYIYYCGLVISVCFMVCVSLERYLVIAHPLWYHFKRTIKNSVVVSVVVWLIPPVYILTVFPWVTFDVTEIIFAASLVIPFPFFIFFLVGTLRALSACVAVPSEEKRRIVVILVLVLLIYTLLFLPYIIWILVRDRKSDKPLNYMCDMFPKLSLLADLILYIYIRKEAVGILVTTVCCCKMQSSDANINTIDVDNI